MDSKRNETSILAGIAASYRELEDNIENNYIQPTEDEHITANEIIKRISTKVCEEDLSNVNRIKRLISTETAEMPHEQQKRIEKIVTTIMFGNGPLDNLFADPEISDILVQRYDNIIYEKNGVITASEAVFINEEHLQRAIKRLMQSAGKEINLAHPIEDGILSDGTRINATLPPVSIDGATLSIRRFTEAVITGHDYLKQEALSEGMLKFLIMCVKSRFNIAISGGTGTGKTTLLNMLSSYIPSNEVIITIEDNCELKINRKNLRRMQVREIDKKDSDIQSITMQELVRAALRQRPDRIILGETRDGTIVDIISAMSTGHEGSMTTIHANDPYNLCNVRIPILFSMNKSVDFSEKAIAIQVKDAIQVIVHIKKEHGKRYISSISYIDNIDRNNKLITKDIFWFSKEKQSYEYLGYIPDAIKDKIKVFVPGFDEKVFGKEA